MIPKDKPHYLRQRRERIEKARWDDAGLTYQKGKSLTRELARHSSTEIHQHLAASSTNIQRQIGASSADLKRHIDYRLGHSTADEPQNTAEKIQKLLQDKKRTTLELHQLREIEKAEKATAKGAKGTGANGKGKGAKGKQQMPFRHACFSAEDVQPLVEAGGPPAPLDMAELQWMIDDLD